MKKYSLLFFFSCSFAFLIHAQEQIKFLDANFGEVLALAELEGKLVFVDAYTDWCAPCKQMEKKVFTKKEVANFYNSNFINVKINMEKGEGKEIAKKYVVSAYPSFLFVNYDGSIAHRFAGYRDEKGFIALGSLALDTNNNLEALTQQYKNGERSADFLMKYLQASFQGADGNHVEILEAYLATQKDWNQPEVQELIFNLLDQPNSPLFDHLVQNKKAYDDIYGATNVSNKIQTITYESLNKGLTKIEDADQLFKRAYPQDAKRLAAHYKMIHYQHKEDGKGYAMAASDYVKNNPNISLEELNDISWGFYDLVNDRKDLKKAIKWAKKSVKKDNSYLNNDTLAALYHKYGKSKKALKIATKAIKLAKASGEDYTTATELIQEIKQGE